jgi:alkanesulfonate monooxygenase SsuD/methylene tetrahydromethanopterin reductase-like flavin-dependent oxidoreductase (luciferase family)
VTAPLHVAVALDGAGWHPAAWRHPSAHPDELFSAGYWTRLARTAERGRLDFLTIEDSFGLQSSRYAGPDGRTDQVRGRLDAVLIASLLGPLTSSIGLVPTVNTTHTEPFHVASAISTLDFASHGRAGWRPQISVRRCDADHVGRREVPEIHPRRAGDAAAEAFVAEIFADAADSVEVVRRLWDSWEDDAEIRDVATGRFIDRDKLHYVDFEGRFFSVKGPSIVPRPPQGQPLVVALAHSQVPWEFAARSADVVLVTPTDEADVERWVGNVRAAEAAVGRTGEPLTVMVDVEVHLDASATAAAARKAWLDELDGRPQRSDAAIFTGTPAELADLLLAWQARGVAGFRLRPAVIDHDLDQIVDALVPELQRRGAFREDYAAGTLRARFGFSRPPSRYAMEVPT